MNVKAEIITGFDDRIAETIGGFGFSKDTLEFTRRKISLIEWLNNFEAHEIEGAITLASAITYVTAEDLARSLAVTAAMLRRILGTDLPNAHFFQLGNSPADSGGNFLYSLRKMLRLRESAFPSASPQSYLNLPTPVVFIDDLIGTGNQAISFSSRYLEDITGPVYYCAMYALEEGLKNVQQNSRYMSVFSPNIIRAADRAFSELGPFSSDANLRERLRRLAEKYGERLYPDHPLGYQDSQLLLAFQHNVPNNTLPIFWAGPDSESLSTTSWHPLFPRFKEASASASASAPAPPPKDVGTRGAVAPRRVSRDTAKISSGTALASVFLLLCDQYSDGSWGRTLYRASGRAFTTDTSSLADQGAAQKRALSITSWAGQSLLKALGRSDFGFMQRARAFVFDHYSEEKMMFGNVYTMESGTPSIPRENIFVSNPRHTSTALKFIEGCDGLTDTVHRSTLALMRCECAAGGWAEREGGNPNCLTTAYVIDYLAKILSRRKYRSRFGESDWVRIRAVLNRGYAWLSKTQQEDGFWYYDNQIAFSPFYTATVLAFCPEIWRVYPSAARKAVSALLNTRRDGRVAYEIGSYSSISTTALLAFALLRMGGGSRHAQAIGELHEAVEQYFLSPAGVGENYTVLDSIFTLALANGAGLSDETRSRIDDMAKRYDACLAVVDPSDVLPCPAELRDNVAFAQARDRIREVGRFAP